ncbi:MAG TPA: ABC transporter permease [Gammaproteobacteria bacterium]|nr:ABC transporter permease [Gammaproteobacteria bacterium]
MRKLVDLVRLLYSRRELIAELVRRELRDEHMGTTIGALWAYGQPLLLMIMYAVLFAYVFPARFGSKVSMADYSACVMAGIVQWLAFQNLLFRAPGILIQQASLVKQIVFPTQVLPVKTAIASALPYSVAVLFAIGYSAYHDTLSWWTLALPWLIFCQMIAMTGVAFLFSAGGVFIRDLREFVMIFTSINLFAQPILYNPFATPKALHTLFYFNPFSYETWCWQDALFRPTAPHVLAWIVFPLCSFATFIIGWLVFDSARHSFGDAL